MYYNTDDLIKVLNAIKRTEVDSLKEDCDNQDFLTGVAFGMNFIIDRISDYNKDKESLLDTYDIVSACTGYANHESVYTYYTSKEWNEED